jgi:hypothetical protein
LTKKLAVTSVLTVRDVLDLLHSKLRLQASEHGNVRHMLKRTDHEQYLEDDCQLQSYLFIRKAIQRHEEIHLSLVQPTSLSHVDRPQYLSADSQIFDQWFTDAQQLLTSRTGSDWIASQELKRPLEFQLKGLTATTDQLRDKFFYVQVDLIHGNRMICPSIVSAPQRFQPGHEHGVSLEQEFVMLAMSKVIWNDWLRAEITVATIPLETRVCISVFWRPRLPTGAQKPLSLGSTTPVLGEAVRVPDDPLSSLSTSVIPFAHGNFLLFDASGALVTGEIVLKLWSGGPANPIGTCSENLGDPDAPSIAILFHQYPQPVFFSSFLRISSPPHRIPLPTPAEEQQLLATLQYDPLRAFDETEKALLWRYREWCLTSTQVPAKALIRLLRCVNWTDNQQIRDAYRLMKSWDTIEPIDALELLDANFADRHVRRQAVRYLNRLSNLDLSAVLLQLVQVVKYEPKHFSYLACWLLWRARMSPLHIGHPLFWHLYAEMHVPETSERFRILLEFFLRLCTDGERESYAKEVRMQWSFKEVAGLIKRTPHSQRKKVFDKEIQRIASIEGRFRMPSDPTRIGRKLIPAQCKYMTSAKAPLWLVFENVSNGAPAAPLLFKFGDDLRQDQLTLQMFSLMNQLWVAEGLDLRLSLYGAVSTGDMMGYIEVVQNSKTLAHIQAEAGGVSGAFLDSALADWLRIHNINDIDYALCVDNFIYSCAGYCVGTYVLGIGDRHNDNIMLNKNGMLFHIDFGHFLGNVKRFFGVRRERAPFIFTPAFLYVMGGSEHPNYQRFVELACRAYNVLRKSSTLFINLFAMMLSTGIPELRCENDIAYLRDAFSLSLTDAGAAQLFARLINESLRTRTTALNFGAHIFAQKFSLGI